MRSRASTAWSTTSPASRRPPSSGNNRSPAMPDLAVTRLDHGQVERLIPSFAALLQDAVDDGASVGFLPPLATAEATAYWRGLLPDLEQGTLLLFAAVEGDQVLGTVQLALAQKPNGRHRAEIQKLLVLRAARRRGLATRLMAAAEAAAVAEGRRLLVLDTLLDNPAERLYLRLGWTSAGTLPHYALGPDGGMYATHFFYKLLA